MNLFSPKKEDEQESKEKTKEKASLSYVNAQRETLDG